MRLRSKQPITASVQTVLFLLAFIKTLSRLSTGQSPVQSQPTAPTRLLSLPWKLQLVYLQMQMNG